MRQLFYTVVLLVALAGQVSGAAQTLAIPVIWAVPAVSGLELGAIVVLANADVRRRLGEHAVASRLLSAAIAAGAVAFNWLAHPDKLHGGFFAGMSALGYLVWLMHTENGRRDRLRATGDLPPTAPAYEPLAHWLRHPSLTLRARSLARAHPGLGLYGSIDAARADLRQQRRTAAIAKVLSRKIRAAVDPVTADIAVAVYDLDEIAAHLAASADYPALTALIAADLAPARIAATATSTSPGPASPVTGRPTGPLPSSVGAQPATPPADHPDTSTDRTANPPQTPRSAPHLPLERHAEPPQSWSPAQQRTGSRTAATGPDPTRPASHAAAPTAAHRHRPTGPDESITADKAHRESPAPGSSRRADPEDTQVDGRPPTVLAGNATDAAAAESEPAPPTVDTAPAAATPSSTSPGTAAPHAQHAPGAPTPTAAQDRLDPQPPQHTAQAVAYWLARDPALTPKEIGTLVGRSERTARRYWPATGTPARPST